MVMSTTGVSDTLDFLLGAWSLERELTDHRTGAHGWFTGSAEVKLFDRARARASAALELTSVSAVYRESGTLRFAGHEGPAERELRFLPAAGAVQMLFSDGRPFANLDLRDGSCHARHDCRADRYELRFDLAGPDRLNESWRVLGPSKDYEALTSWSRCAFRDGGVGAF